MEANVFESSIYFGVLLSLGSYGIGIWLKRLTGWGFMNPLFVSIVLVIAVLQLMHIDYDLCLDSLRLGDEATANMIAQYARGVLPEAKQHQ